MNKIKIAAPGRINLIGEHVDYNDGFVLPAAIDKCIYMELSKNGHKSRCSIKSEGYDTTLVADLHKLERGTEGWHNYILGVLNEMKKLTPKLRGFDCHVESKVPVGAGVSSSAALECGLAFGLNELFDLGLDKWELAKLGQRAEHNFVGTKCGIMDQFASIFGKKDHSMLLDCRSLEFEYIPTKIAPYKLLLLNTNVAHNLSTGEYNIRRQQCEDGLDLLSDKYNMEKSFRNVTPGMLEESRKELGSLLHDRCSFVIEEIQRVQAAVIALKAMDLNKFGGLMKQTHEGLSKKYEVSCPELDFLVEIAKSEPKVLGSRMMGGGFGGCTLNLVLEDAVDQFVGKASKAYRDKFGIDLSYYITMPSQGTTIINNT